MLRRKRLTIKNGIDSCLVIRITSQIKNDMQKKIPIQAAPKYRQIHFEIKNLIDTGKILPGEAVPSENEIRNKYKVSRFTAQQVFRLLVDEGLVVRKQGMGTFVREINGRGNTVELQLGGIHAPGSAMVEAQFRFARLVSELTMNQVQVRVQPSAAMGPASDQLKMLCCGEQDMFGAGTNWLEQIEPNWGITNLAFLFRNTKHVRQFVKSDIALQLRERLLNKKGIRVLAENWIRPSSLLLSTIPCFDLKDLSGLKIRVPPIPTHSLIWKEIGAIPCELAWSQVRAGLEQGIIQGLDAPRDMLYLEGFHRVARYITHTRHHYSRACILISEKKFSRLRPDIQKALTQAAHEIGEAYSVEALRIWEEEKQIMLREGARFIITDTEPFRKQMTRLYKKNRRLNKTIQSIIEIDQ